MANLWQTQQTQNARRKAKQPGTSSAGGLGAMSPAAAQEQQNKMSSGYKQSNTASGGLLGVDSATRRTRSGNVHGIVDNGAWYNPDNRNPNATRRNYPDLSGIPASQGGTMAAGVRSGRGANDAQANAMRRGLRAPGEKKRSVAGTRTDKPSDALLSLNAPREESPEDRAANRDRKRQMRGKGNGPNTMITGLEKLG